MRISGLIVIGITGFAFSGCSQISSVFKKKPHYHDATGQAVYVNEDTSLRQTPEQGYQFADQSYDVTIYDRASLNSTDYQYSGGSEYIYANTDSNLSKYANYDVELYSSGGGYNNLGYSDPRDTEFVKLNGESDLADWRNCETLNRGYLLASEYDFGLNPDFEVCMRNKGYVLGTEYGPSSKPSLNAMSAKLRGGYSQTSFYSSSSGFYR